VADLSAVADGSVDAVAAIDLVEHVDDPTLAAMLRECRRVLAPGGRLGIYTPDRAHYVERMKAHDFVLKQFPQHIAVRRVGAYRRFLAEARFAIDLEAWSVSPFPGVRWVERALAPLPLLGPTFRYRILLRAVRPADPAT
jgi:SAM-dependent methyltransferase